MNNKHIIMLISSRINGSEYDMMLYINSDKIFNIKRRNNHYLIDRIGSAKREF